MSPSQPEVTRKVRRMRRRRRRVGRQVDRKSTWNWLGMDRKWK